MQQPLLSDKIPVSQRRAQSHRFMGILSRDKPTTPMDIERADNQPEYYIEGQN